MKSITQFLAFSSVLVLTVFHGVASTTITQTPVTGWYPVDGEDTGISNINTSSPTWGTGFPNSSDNTTICAGFAGVDLAVNGDSVSLSGSVELFGGQGGYDQLRIGLYNSGGLSGTRGWTGGYYFSNSHGDRAGFLRMRKNSEWDRNPSSSAGGTGKGGFLYADGKPLFTQPEYNFLLELTRISATSINVTMSLVSVDGSYRFSHVYLDTTASPESFHLDRVAFLSGDQLDTDQIYLRNVTLTHSYTQVPEPSAGGLLLAGAVLTLVRRRRRPS